MKWGMQACYTFGVVPPGFCIVHQVNLEHLARGVHYDAPNNVYYPDTLVGTDSHTTMINGLGIVGWGVGGIEAEAGMLGQPVYFLTPDVVGVHLSGRSEEHPSDLQSLMRISYAVFCLKKKTKTSQLLCLHTHCLPYQYTQTN